MKYNIEHNIYFKHVFSSSKGKFIFTKCSIISFLYNIKLLSSHNPFMNFNKSYDEKNILQERNNNNENIQNNENPFYN